MAFTDFTPDTFEQKLRVKSRLGQLFPNLQPVPVPTWLTELLAKTEQLALYNEKSRSEFISVSMFQAFSDQRGSFGPRSHICRFERHINVPPRRQEQCRLGESIADRNGIDVCREMVPRIE